MFADVISVEHGVFCGLADAGAGGEEVSEGGYQNAKISGERFYAADRIRAHRLKGETAAFFFDKNRNGAKRLKHFLHGHGAGARTPAAVRRGKRIGQIQVHDVYAEVARSRDATEGVHVVAVHIPDRAFGVENLRDFGDALFEDAER